MTLIVKLDETTGRLARTHEAGKLIIENETFGKEIKIIGNDTFSWGNLVEVVLPDTVEVIEGGAFGANNIVDLYLGESLVKIGDNAFFGNKIKVIALPDTIKEIGFYAFSSNYELESVYLPASLETIPDDAFQDTNGYFVTYVVEGSPMHKLVEEGSLYPAEVLGLEDFNAKRAAKYIKPRNED